MARLGASKQLKRITMSNPYCPDRSRLYTPCVLVGREAAYAYLHQHLIDGSSPQAVVFLGARHIGKSALLWHFQSVFDQQSIGVYLPLRTADVDPEAGSSLLLQFATAIRSTLHHHNYLLTHVPEPPTDTRQDTHSWFADVFLPEIFTTIRPHRRLILLIDDADMWLANDDEQGLSTDMVARLSALLQHYQQMGMVLALDEMHEPQLSALAPLVDPTQIYRLGLLAPASIQPLMAVSDRFTLHEDASQYVYRLTGGHPLLLQWFGWLLYEQSDEDTAFSTADVQALLSRLPTEVYEFIESRWQQLTRDEQRVLVAISHLRQRQPAQPISANQIERWLVESDNPLDGAAVRSALRGLAYAHVLQQTDTGVRLAATLWQLWLQRRMSSAAETVDRSRRNIAVALAALLVVILLVWGAIQLLPDAESVVEPVAPTVTLASPAS